MGPTPFYGARAEKPPKTDFAMKQTNICRLSGDIKTEAKTEREETVNSHRGLGHHRASDFQ